MVGWLACRAIRDSLAVVHVFGPYFTAISTAARTEANGWMDGWMDRARIAVTLDSFGSRLFHGHACALIPHMSGWLVCLACLSTIPFSHVSYALYVKESKKRMNE